MPVQSYSYIISFFLLKSLRWFVPSVIGLLAIWMIGGNFLASQQEKEIEQDFDEFVKRFPNTKANDSALKLRALMAKLGIHGDGTSEFAIDAYTMSHPDFAVSESDLQAFEAIREELEEYLDAQLSKPNDNIAPIPNNLSQYLKENAENIKDIRQHILNHEVPQWERNINPIKHGDIGFYFPSYSNLFELQMVMTLDILNKKNSGQLKDAEEMLEVAWKINKSLHQDYYIGTQFTALSTANYTTGVIRKIEYLPVEWKHRLLEYDYDESLTTSLEGGFLMGFKFVQNLHLYSGKYLWREPNWLFALFKIPIWMPYYRFYAIDTYKREKQLLEKYHHYNICLHERFFLQRLAAIYSPEIYGNKPWWQSVNLSSSINPSTSIILLFFIDQSYKTKRYMLDLELTQKILQVKELAAKAGKWPQSVPNMESKICPGVKWVYQVSPDGTTMSIYLNEQPEWLTESIENNSALPLTYSTQQIPDYDKSLNE